MDELEPLRLAVVGTATSVQQVARRSGEFASFRATAEFPTADGTPSSLADWLDGEPTAEADAVCFIDEQSCSVALAEQSIGQGLHVWCAGPLTADTTMLDSVAAQAAAAGVTLVCGGAARYTSGAQLAADALASGNLGRLVCLRALQLGADPHARWPLGELLALANTLAGDAVATVYGQSAGKRHLSVSLSYTGGATALLALGAASGTPPLSELMMIGNRGAFYDTMAPTALLMLPAGDGDTAAYSEEDGGPVLGRWADQCARAVLAGDTPPVTPQLARQVAELMNHVERSVQNGVPVPASSAGESDE